MFKRNQNGFTIVELLIVIVVIAILAAITIVAYNGIQNRANDTVVQSDLNNVAKKLEMFAALNSGAYPTTSSDIESLGVKVTSSSYAVNPTVTRNFILCPSSSPNEYALVAKSKSGNGYIVRNSAKTPQPFTTAWDAGSTAGYLCASLGGNYSTASAAGYWTSQTPNWSTWTGV